MSQDHDEPNDDELEPEPEDEGNLAGLRRKAKAGDKALNDNLDLRKQLAFLRAGIDPEASKVARGFYETWKGDVNDIDSLKAEAKEWGLIKDETSGEGGNVDPVRQAEDARRAQLQDNLTGGKPGGEQAPTPHPREQALEEYQRDIRAGRDPQGAAIEAFQKVIGAAMQGDKRVFFDGEQHRRDAQEADRISGAPAGVV